MFALALAATLLSGQEASSAPSSPSDLTRDLNSGPPFKPTIASQPQPPATSSQTGAAPVQAGASSVTRDLNSLPAGRTPAAAPAPATPSATSAATRAEPSAAAPTSPAARPAITPSPRPTPATTPAVTPPAAPTSSATSAAPSANPGGVSGLDAAAIAALPFTLELPQGLILTRAPAGADAAVYSVRGAGGLPLVMIYAGPASQFPIYDGEVVRAGGRASVVVSEGGRRQALEHLFQRSSAPQEIHIWVASVDGADRDLAERIAQSVDAR